VLELEPGLASDAILRRIASEGALRAKGFVETSAGTRLVQDPLGQLRVVAQQNQPPEKVVILRHERVDPYLPKAVIENIALFATVGG